MKAKASLRHLGNSVPERPNCLTLYVSLHSFLVQAEEVKAKCYTLTLRTLLDLRGLNRLQINLVLILSKFSIISWWAGHSL